MLPVPGPVASFQTSACSRAPDPTTSTFIISPPRVPMNFYPIQRALPYVQLHHASSTSEAVIHAKASHLARPRAIPSHSSPGHSGSTYLAMENVIFVLRG